MPTSALVSTTGDRTTTTNAFESVVGAALPESSSGIFEVKIVGRKASNGTTRAWAIVFAAKRNGSGSAQIIDSLVNLISPLGDLGALLWDIRVRDDGSSAYVDVKGESGATIDWTAHITGVTIQS